MVLFLFVIMMARLDLEELKIFLAHMSVFASWRYIAFEMFAIISYGFSNYSNSEENISSSSNTYQIGMRLYTEKFSCFSDGNGCFVGCYDCCNCDYIKR